MEAPEPPPNRLASEQSPYLLQHARNPVDWYPWGEEAFDRARDLDRPIFLSIGYATCHWCHVMERESFEDPAVASLLNEAFVSIKVDREERPDVDAVYMTVCQMMTGHGGWPLTIVMTPDLEPFFAGTYFPRDSRAGRIGMMELVPRLQGLWTDQRERVLDAASSAVAALREHERQAGAGQPSQPLVESEAERAASIDTLHAGFQQLAARFDPRHGGFGSAPKFPTPHQLSFLLRYHHRTGNAPALEMVEATLRGMRAGGIFDHLGYGFHRYSTDERWLVPHFEKMLYDQALLALVSIETWQASGDPTCRRLAEEVLDYVRRDMTDGSGGFYSAEDADSEGVEGKYYVWTDEEIDAALDEKDARFARLVFGIERAGNFTEEATGVRTGANVLHYPSSLAELVDRAAGMGLLDADAEGDLEACFRRCLARVRERLLEVRGGRVPPLKDDKVLTDWNGLMIAAFASAARALGRPDYATIATRAAGFIRSRLSREDGELLHRFRGDRAGIRATASDYAYLTWGLTELYAATFDPAWLDWALDLTDRMIDRFWDGEGAGFYTTASSSRLPVRQKELYDGATPSINSVAWLNLLRLARMTGRTDLEQRAARMEAALGPVVSRSPAAHTMWLVAMDFALGPAHEIVLAPARGADDLDAMVRELGARFLPRTVTLLRPPEPEDMSAIASLAPEIESRTALGESTTVYICTGYQCDAPFEGLQRLEAELAALPG